MAPAARFRLTKGCHAGDPVANLQPYLLDRRHAHGSAADHDVETSMHIATRGRRIYFDHDIRVGHDLSVGHDATRKPADGVGSRRA
jgi:hypothetical protein